MFIIKKAIEDSIKQVYTSGIECLKLIAIMFKEKVVATKFKVLLTSSFEKVTP